MQRYSITALQPKTYTIYDARDGLMYLLYVESVFDKNVNLQFILSEITPPTGDRFVSFTKEVMNFRFWVANWQQVINVIENVFQSLHRGEDISNPTNLNLSVGYITHDGKLINAPIPKNEIH